MKRLLSLVLAALCLCSAAPAAHAADNTYELPELNMTIEAPEGWYVFTQDVKEDDPNLKPLGLDGKVLADNYKKKNIYLDMFSPDNSYEIFVSMTPHSTSSAIHDFNSILDEDMLPKAESLMQGLQKKLEGQRTYYDCSVYTHKQTKFAIFQLSYQSNGDMTYGKQYYTIINGQAINIVLYSFDNEISDEMAQILQNTVDSIYFTKITQPAVSSTALAASQVYEFPEFNMTIETPEGWIAFTQDMDINDPNLALVGLDGESLADQLKENNTCLYIVSTESVAEIYLTITDSEIYQHADFNKISDDVLLPMIESSVREAEKNAGGPAFTNFSVYNHKQTKFVVYDAPDPKENDVKVYGKQYFTVINGQCILITLKSYGNKVTDSLDKTARGVVDSIFFTEVSSEPTNITAIILVIAGIIVAAVSIGIIARIVRRARLKKLPPREIDVRSHGLGDISLK